MKKYQSYIFNLIFVGILLICISSVAQGDWIKRYDSDNITEWKTDMELWEGKGKGWMNYKTELYKETSIGGIILKSYGYVNWDIKDKNNYYFDSWVLKKEYKEYYPDSFLKIKYMGCDVEGNIQVKIIQDNAKKDNLKELYKKINEVKLIKDSKERQKINYIFMLVNKYYKKYGNKEYIVNPNKTIIFDDNLIPPLKIETNSKNTNIEVKIINQ